jgi:uncharacterized protein (DUF849 family)
VAKKGLGSIMLIKAAINGGRTRADCPALPVTPAQQAPAAAEVVAAGAGAIHVHVRGTDERESLAAEDVGDRLVFRVADEGQARPTEFRTRPGQVLRVSQREAVERSGRDR